MKLLICFAFLVAVMSNGPWPPGPPSPQGTTPRGRGWFSYFDN